MLALISALVFCSLSLEAHAVDQARADWLYQRVRDHAAENPGMNVIAFAKGRYNFQGPVVAKTIKYQANGCDLGIRGLGSATIGGRLGDVANRGIPAVLPGSAREATDRVINYVNYCPTFKLVAFQSGTFIRDGDGGFDNWCFTGNRLAVHHSLG